MNLEKYADLKVEDIQNPVLRKIIGEHCGNPENFLHHNQYKQVSEKIYDEHIDNGVSSGRYKTEYYRYSDYKEHEDYHDANRYCVKGGGSDDWSD